MRVARMRTRHRRFAFLAAFVCAATQLSCGDDCSAEARDGLKLRIEGVLAGGCLAHVVAQDGSYIETMMGQAVSESECDYGAANERAGTYTVTVTAPGFKPATTVVEVPANACHVFTQTVVITLEPLAAGDGGSDAYSD
jgi:hypothetical protein